MSAIDIVLVVTALVAVGVAVACALQLKGLRAELQERGDDGAEMLAALEQANNALDTLNVALAETRRTANAIAQQQTTDAAVEQQRYLTIAREFSQAGDRMDDLRRETAQQLGANREGIEQLRGFLAPLGYHVEGVAVTGCLHLKSAVTQVAEDAISCVAEGTGKSLESLNAMQDGTVNLSRRRQMN